MAELRVFLVERYWPGTTVEEVRALVERLEAAGRGARARHVSSLLIPDEDSLFCVFLAESLADVEAVNAAAGAPYDRLVEAIQVTAPSK